MFRRGGRGEDPVEDGGDHQQPGIRLDVGVDVAVAHHRRARRSWFNIVETDSMSHNFQVAESAGGDRAATPRGPPRKLATKHSPSDRSTIGLRRPVAVPTAMRNLVTAHQPSGRSPRRRRGPLRRSTRGLDVEPLPGRVASTTSASAHQWPTVMRDGLRAAGVELAHRGRPPCTATTRALVNDTAHRAEAASLSG